VHAVNSMVACRPGQKPQKVKESPPGMVLELNGTRCRSVGNDDVKPHGMIAFDMYLSASNCKAHEGANNC